MINKPSQGVESTRQLHQAVAEEEQQIETQKRSELKKGAARVEERAKSSDGKGAGQKQR
jgi:hypothetical protein